MPETPTKCLIALGGNTGAVEQTFETAIEQLRQAGCLIHQRSRDYRSAPMGTHAGDIFLNAAVCLSTTREPVELLDLLQDVEDACGRERSVHWGPRTLDLDLLFYGPQVIRSPRLTVPHPGLWYRRFVLDPLVEIAAEWVHPIYQQSIEALHARLLQRPLVIDVSGMDDTVTDFSCFSDGAVKIRSGESGSRHADDSSPPFCRLRSSATAACPAMAEPQESGAFEIVVSPHDLEEFLRALRSAALGE